MFYILAGNIRERDALLASLKSCDIQAIFHYTPLHTSPYYKKISKVTRALPRAEKYGDCLIRLPFYIDLSMENIDNVVGSVAAFYHSLEKLKQ